MTVNTAKRKAAAKRTVVAVSPHSPVNNPHPPARTSMVDDYNMKMLTMIERVVTDPSIDVSKLREMIELQERMRADQASREFHSALNALQPLLPVIKKKGLISIEFKNGKGSQSTPYALKEDIQKAIRPLYTRAGFSTSFNTRNEQGKIVVVLKLSHNAGHTETYESPPMPLDTSGSKNNIQAAGSTVSYGQRYCLIGAFDIVTEGLDDDGAGGGDKASKGGKFDEMLREESGGAIIEGAGNEITALGEADKIIEVMRKQPLKSMRGRILMKNKGIMKALDEEGHTDKIAELQRTAEEGEEDGPAQQ